MLWNTPNVNTIIEFGTVNCVNRIVGVNPCNLDWFNSALYMLVVSSDMERREEFVLN
jgi:hypothetical protein